MSFVDEVELAVVTRMEADTGLTDLLRDGADGIVWLRPARILEAPIGGDVTSAFDEEELPVLIYYGAGGTEGHVAGLGEVTVRFEAWVYPSGANGGKGRLADIDARLETLFREGRPWVHNSRRYASVSTALGPVAPEPTVLKRARHARVAA